MNRSGHPAFRTQRWALLLLLIASLTVFVVRGPLRASHNRGIDDLLPPLAQSSAWLHGEDPYSPRSLLRFWPKEALDVAPPLSEIQDGSVLMKRGFPTAYPPTCLALLALLTLPPWPFVNICWIVLTVGLFFNAVWMLATRFGLDGLQKRIFIIFSLLLAPFHTGIVTRNISVLAIECGVIGIVLTMEESESHIAASGTLIAVSAILKPQIGFVFVAYGLIRRAWRLFVVVSVSCFVMATIAMMRMAHIQWFASYLADNRALLSTGILGDFTSRNPTRFGLLNLHVALYPLLRDRQFTNLCVLLVCCALCLGTLVLILRVDARRDDLLAISLVATLSLLPIYHRLYDGALLILPLCWLVKRIGNTVENHLWSVRLDIPSIIGLLTIGAFFVPGGSFLETLRDRGTIPVTLSQTPWWNALVMAHAVWCLVALTSLMLYQLYKTGARCKDLSAMS